MNSIVGEIIKSLSSESLDEKEEATLAIALLLEKHSPLRNEEIFYQNNLPQTLSLIALSQREIEEIIEEIGKLLLIGKITPSLVWAISKSQQISSFKILLAVLKQHYENEDILWQGLIGIETSISVNNNKSAISQIRKLLKEPENAYVIKKTTESNSIRLRQLAERIEKQITSQADN